MWFKLLRAKLGHTAPDPELMTKLEAIQRAHWHNGNRDTEDDVAHYRPVLNDQLHIKGYVVFYVPPLAKRKKH